MAELQDCLLILVSDALTAKFLGLALLDVLAQAEEVLSHGDLLDVGQDKTALSRDRDGNWI